jgi:hypothetical protein
MELSMEVVRKSDQPFPQNMRILFGFLAVVNLLSYEPWSQTSALKMAIGYTLSLMWALMAINGNKPGWTKTLTLAVGITAIALIALRLAGVAA